MHTLLLKKIYWKCRLQHSGGLDPASACQWSRSNFVTDCVTWILKSISKWYVLTIWEFSSVNSRHVIQISLAGHHGCYEMSLNWCGALFRCQQSFGVVWLHLFLTPNVSPHISLNMHPTQTGNFFRVVDSSMLYIVKSAWVYFVLRKIQLIMLKIVTYSQRYPPKSPLICEHTQIHTNTHTYVYTLS